jgi:hypothetical protein
MVIVLQQRRVMQRSYKHQAWGNQCNCTGIPPMALGKGCTTIHNQGYISRRSMTPPMHGRRKLGRQMPSMMRRRVAVAMMVVAKVVGEGGTEDPPIIIGDIPPA